MYIVAVAWIFVVLLMAVAEATSTQGTVLGAFFTLVLYGALPLSVVLYLMGTPARKRARRAAEQVADQAAEQAAELVTSATDGNRSGHAPGGPGTAVTPEREKP